MTAVLSREELEDVMEEYGFVPSNDSKLVEKYVAYMNAMTELRDKSISEFDQNSDELDALL